MKSLMRIVIISFVVVGVLMHKPVLAEFNYSDSYPEFMKSMTAAQLRAYYKSLPPAAKKTTGKITVQNIIPRSNINEVIETGKEDFKAFNFEKAYASFEHAMLIDSTNQKANFWYALSILTNNQAILKEMKERKLINDKGIFNPETEISLPDVISFKHYQGLNVGLLEEIRLAKESLRVVNTTFSDDISRSDLGKLRLDYASVQVLNMFVHILEMQVHLANAYETDAARLTKNDRGVVTVENFSKITTSPQALFNDLVRLNYLTEDGKPTGNQSSIEFLKARAILIYDSVNQTNIFYTYLGTWASRAPLSEGACGLITVSDYGSKEILATLTTTLHPDGYCKSESWKKPANVFSNSYSVGVTINSSAGVYASKEYANQYQSLDAFLKYVPVDPILIHPKRSDIFKILENVQKMKVGLLDLIEYYSGFLGFKTETASELQLAKTSFVAFLNSYLSMMDYLLERDRKDGVQYAINLYTGPEGEKVDPKEYAQAKKEHQSDEIAVRELITSIKANLDDPMKNPFVVIPDAKIFSEYPYRNIKLNLASFFNSPRDIRNYARVFDAMLKKYDMLTDKFFDPTLGGLIVSGQAADINAILGKSPEISSIEYNKKDSTALISWRSDLFLPADADITSFTIYRSTTSQVDKTSILLAQVNAKVNNSYRDTLIDPKADHYYYRVYVSYSFKDGSKAESYSKPVKLQIAPSAKNEAPIVFNVAPITVNEGSSLQFNINAVDNDGDEVLLTAQVNGSSLASVGASLITSRMGNATIGKFIWDPTRFINGGIILLTITADDQRGSKVQSSVIITVRKTVAQPIGSIQGVVRNVTTNKPIKRANVIIKGPAGYESSDKSDPEFNFISLKPGIYTLTVTKPGYKTYTQNIIVEAGSSLRTQSQVKNSIIVLLQAGK